MGPLDLCLPPGGTDNFVTSVNGANSAYTNLFLNGAVVKLGTGGSERMRIDASGNWCRHNHSR